MRPYQMVVANLRKLVEKVGASGGTFLGPEVSVAETNGVSRMTADACDGGVYIPMSGRTESLNASAAAAIILWEMKRSGNG